MGVGGRLGGWPIGWVAGSRGIILDMYGTSGRTEPAVFNIIDFETRRLTPSSSKMDHFEKIRKN